MCCRVLLVVIVLTCTFQCEIKAESDGQSSPRIDHIKDVMCVLLLSGLRKEDLDGNVLKKLQKHNVNIDDLHKRETIEKCAMKAISEGPKSDISPFTEQLLPKQSDIYETTTPVHLENHNVTETTTATQTFHDNDGTVNMTYTNKRQIMNKDSVLFSIENVMNLWRMINTAKPIDDNQTVQVSRQHLFVDMPIKKKTDFDSQQKESELIKTMIEHFNAAKQIATSTQKPTTYIHMDVISEQIQKFLKNNNNDYKHLISRLTELNNNSSTQTPYEYKEQARRSLSMRYINELLNAQDSDKRIDPTGNHNQYPYNVGILQKYVPHEEYTVKYPKPLEDNIIKEITEQVKKTLLKDFKQQFTSTTLKTTTGLTTVTTTTTLKTPKDNSHKPNETDIFEKIKVLFQEFKKEATESTTELQTEATTDIASTTTVLQIAHDSIKDATYALANFIELYKQFKQVRDRLEPVTRKYKLATEKPNSNQAQPTSSAVYQPLLPLNYAVHVQSQPPSASQAKPLLPVVINQYPSFLHMSHPILEKTHTFQQVQQERYTIRRPLGAEKLSNIYQNPVNNLKGKIGEMNVLQGPPVIQTDAIEVPPLGIPVPNSINAINTNIIVTTQHPLVQQREEYQHHNTRDPRYLDFLIRSEGGSNDWRSGKPDSGLVKTSDADSDFKYRSEMNRNYGLGNVYVQQGIPHSNRLPKIRQSPGDDHFYRGHISKVKVQGDPVDSWHHNRDNYRDGLERELEWQRDTRHDWNFEAPDSWQREIRERENLQIPDQWQMDYRNEKRLERPRHGKVHHGEKSRDTTQKKVASRQQLSMYDLKKRAKYDDTHFKRFLKTQQKVNDMLENILATRSPDKIRSVETPDTVHAYVP